ncbi:gluconokinase [Neoasaia chiangmaiensis NBRC 101099]|uniref:Gluconokinase n=1 Tax=Neoasaia chiangmaiensis TaxID=320497 RepID=A0A1U9KNP6_9PROT|nr:gluconokinase [Neoasaia chiangmaiensis]AQS87369.1 carbohydrate kinase [Neoasaia chiangmaiensis]GBR42958.1 gluconokinase [Neoasaia chiangmaiensis NBRC 101099]GEN16132.1 gluconokinase [Neoasaia chiangmaiensis]
MSGSQASLPPRLVVVMGVSGSGKTTLAQSLATMFDWPFEEGDSLHPAANVEKMHGGIPLTDDDRAPWLEKCHDWLVAHREGGGVLTCSALKRAYRDVLRRDLSVTFVYLHAPEALIASRMTHRPGHFMPASLLPSQLATLEPPGANEHAIEIDSEYTPDQALSEIVEKLRHDPA